MMRLIVRLIAVLNVAALCVVAPSGCNCRLKTNNNRMFVEGPEDWQIGGKIYKNIFTCYEKDMNGVVMYVVDLTVQSEEKLFGINDDSARSIAWPLMRYVWENRKHERKSIPPNRGTVRPSPKIAVNIFSANNRNAPRYQVVVTIGEIVGCINKGDQCNYPGELPNSGN